MRGAAVLAGWLALATAGAGARQAPDGPAVIAAARAALGGAAALDAVKSFTVTGSLTRVLDGRSIPTVTVEYKCILPDKFLYMTRQLSPGGSLTYYSGFNASDLINDEILDTPVPLPQVVPTTPEGVAAARNRQLTGVKRHFAFFLLPMTMRSFDSAPVEILWVGQASTAGGADEFEVTDASGQTRHLFVSATTHVPVRLTWTGNPVTVAGRITTTTRVVTDSRGQTVAPPTTTADGTLLIRDPGALASVPWEMTIGDYSISNGLKWPHRLTTKVDGQPYEDLRLGKFSINPKISDDTFKLRK